MFEIECNNCREVNQLHDRMKDKTVRCHICQDVIQIGEVKKEVVRNINKIDDHENRIQDLEAVSKFTPEQSLVYYPPVVRYIHSQSSSELAATVVGEIMAMIVACGMALFIVFLFGYWVVGCLS